MYWPPDLSIPSSHSGVQRSSRSARPLKAVSGNRQPFALDSHGGPKSQNAHDVYYLDALFSQTKPLSNPFSTNASVPCSDPGPAIRCLHQRQPSRRRQHGSSTGPKYQDRSYLDTEHYQEYRARQRKDVGPDNKQVWSDDVEEAFQEGLLPLRSNTRFTDLMEPLLKSSLWEEGDECRMVRSLAEMSSLPSTYIARLGNGGQGSKCLVTYRCLMLCSVTIHPVHPPCCPDDRVLS